MIIKTWILLTIFSTLIQYILAIKKTPHFIGFFLPAGFLLFAIYAWFDLSKVGLSMGILLSFMIPPVFYISSRNSKPLFFRLFIPLF